MGIYSEFSHWKWWCSIVMLVYQGVFRGVYSIISACLMVKYVKSPWKSPLIPIHLHVRPANFGVPHFRTKPLIVRYCWLGWFHYIHIVSPCVHMLNIEYGKSSRFYVFHNSITITQFYPMISSWYPFWKIPSPTKPSSNLIQSIKIPLNPTKSHSITIQSIKIPLIQKDL